MRDYKTELTLLFENGPMPDGSKFDGQALNDMLDDMCQRIELLEDLLQQSRKWVGFASRVNMVSAVYITPANQLRNQAAKMDAQEKLAKEIREALGGK